MGQLAQPVRVALTGRTASPVCSGDGRARPGTDVISMRKAIEQASKS